MRKSTSFTVALLSVGQVAIGAPTVYLAGDSTMAKGGAGDGATDGWGQYLSSYLTVAVVNDAVAGRSARSYTREGRFTTIANTVKSGDYVIIEFGHNDGGSLTPTDNGRTDCGGTGSETCQTTYNAVAETVLTFTAYMENATNLLKSKGAIVILSSQTPDNPCETGTCADLSSPPRFVGYDKTAASATASTFVDHWSYVMQMDKALGVTAVDAFYPNDHTHTTPTGADKYAQAFVKALTCGSSTLKSYVNSAGNSVSVGNCIGVAVTTTTKATTTTTKAATTTAKASTTTTKAATTTTAAAGATQTHYGQCGGTGYTGPTNCTPYSCVYSNDFYSQCL